MRLLELLLLLTLLPPIVFAFFPQQPPRWVAAMPLFTLVLLLLHLAIEQPRWQMFPAYLLLALLLLVYLWPLLFPSETFEKRWSVAIPLGLLALLTWAVAVALPIVIPVVSLAAPTGPYAVGTAVRYLVDESRTETYSDDATGKRELMAQIWYPADEVANAKRAVYLPALNVMAPVLANQFGLPAFLFNHINLTEMAIYDEPPVAQTEAPFPVLLFSHGLSGLRMQNTAMFQELASHGYVVASVDHTYGNAVTVFPDGRVILYDDTRIFPSDEPRDVQGNALINVWAADLAFLLDEMTAWNEDGGMFDGRFDTQNVGVFGHSTGGGTALEFCLIDDRCKAAAPLDSWVLPVSNDRLANGLNQPVLFISTPQWLGPENRAKGLEIFNTLSTDGYNVAIANTGHYDFSDLVLLSPLTARIGLSGSINSRYSIGIQNAYLVAFFDRYLRGEDRELLERPSPYPEVSIQIHQ